MTAFRTVSKDVACSLLPLHAVEGQKLSSGLFIAAPKTNLVPLTVKADYLPLGLYTGDTVYVPLEEGQTSWGKRKLNVAGIGDFILVPGEKICLVAPANNYLTSDPPVNRLAEVAHPIATQPERRGNHP